MAVVNDAVDEDNGRIVIRNVGFDPETDLMGSVIDVADPFPVEDGRIGADRDAYIHVIGVIMQRPRLGDAEIVESEGDKHGLLLPSRVRFLAPSPGRLRRFVGRETWPKYI